MNKLSRKRSKRVSCRKKYKIIKKVAEHHRKLRRESKKNKQRRKPKDPGVPNSIPFKDEILHEAEQQKQRSKEMREAQKANRLKLQMENRGLEESKNSNGKKSKEVKDVESDTKSNLNNLKKIMDSSDVILQVLDARDPEGCRCPQLEKMIAVSDKKLILVINKIDLVPRQNLQDWLQHLRQEFPTVGFKAATQPDTPNQTQLKVPASQLNKTLQKTDFCIGASLLIDVLKNYQQENEAKEGIKVGVVGFPNVGKKSIISSIKCFKNSKITECNDLQEISIDKKLKLFATPGVILARDNSPASLALKNVFNVNKLKDVITPAESIFDRVDKTQLRLHYYFPEFSSCDELLNLLAKRLGKYKKGGVPNVEEAAKRLVTDWNRGIIKYYTNLPPTHSSLKYTSDMTKGFNLSGIEDKEQVEFDKVQQVFPSKAILAQTSGMTDGLILDTDIEEMDLDNNK